jgi:hypothetical protein
MANPYRRAFADAVREPIYKQMILLAFLGVFRFAKFTNEPALLQHYHDTSCADKFTCRSTGRLLTLSQGIELDS